MFVEAVRTAGKPPPGRMTTMLAGGVVSIRESEASAELITEARPVCSPARSGRESQDYVLAASEVKARA